MLYIVPDIVTAIMLHWHYIVHDIVYNIVYDIVLDVLKLMMLLVRGLPSVLLPFIHSGLIR